MLFTAAFLVALASFTTAAVHRPRQSIIPYECPATDENGVALTLSSPIVDLVCTYGIASVCTYNILDGTLLLQTGVTPACPANATSTPRRRRARKVPTGKD